MKSYTRVVVCLVMMAATTPSNIEAVEQCCKIVDDCQIPLTCESSTNINGTSFQNPGYPLVTTTPQYSCRHKVYPVNSNICQIRLDLTEFLLAQPDIDGVCVKDFMLVTGGATNIPQICGLNSEQHLYLEVTPDFGSVTINVDTSAAGAKWSIAVSQIECNSPYRAPAGCLQYFTNTYGTIKSFNYDATTFRFGTAPLDTTQLANQEYGVCIKSHLGYCSVVYTKSTEYFYSLFYDYSFSLTGDPSIVLPAVGSADCTTDYVMIPKGVIHDPNYAVTTADRYCGANFPSKVETSVQPFVLYVVTDGLEASYVNETYRDGPNVGFSIDYRMLPC
ncbi:uncharacterized protein LOC108672682 isoform X2 [Hyalella azteca]|uniref:Uncharacterized protein LOC108672682 isoform X2 n=1 Tax=Hyalella azteca TaxID=294128 RepID=A0A8B7NQB5_HYAAZ|nr:uncharacterized protein LOC108672682 isoform X2 [Hyalella azteca]